jgi:hypothetical protein
MKTCFISAPVSVDLSTLKSVLESEKIRPILPFELPIAGANFREQIEKAIKKAQFFIGVLSNQAPSLNVLFELGYASAQRKRIAVIQEGQFDLPPNVTGLPILKAKLDDRNQLQSFVKQFARPQKTQTSAAPEASKTKPLSDRSKQLIAHVKALGERATHREFETVLIEALRDSGVRVMAESTQRGGGRYDLAVWIDELEYPIGNPVLIELKNDLKPSTARALRNDFLAQRDFAPGKALLVVYLTSHAKLDISTLSVAAPLVLFVSATELFSALENTSLAEFVRTRRNRLAHGM